MSPADDIPVGVNPARELLARADALERALGGRRPEVDSPAGDAAVDADAADEVAARAHAPKRSGGRSGRRLTTVVGAPADDLVIGADRAGERFVLLVDPVN